MLLEFTTPGMVGLQQHFKSIWPILNSYMNLPHYRGLFFKIVDLRNEAKHPSFLNISGHCACTHPCRCLKFIVSIFWTPLSNFDILHQPQILHTLKAINKFRLTHAYFHALNVHACT